MLSVQSLPTGRHSPSLLSRGSRSGISRPRGSRAGSLRAAPEPSYCSRVPRLICNLMGSGLDPCEGANVCRLVGFPRAAGPNLGDRNTARLGDDRADKGAAHAALARPHATAQKCLRLVGPARAEMHGPADLPGADLLTAADNDIVRRAEHARGRPVERIEKRPDRPLPGKAREV